MYRMTLIVDDDPFFGRLLLRQLASLGCQRAQYSESAQAAVDLVARAPAAIGRVLLDLQMPGMDGIEFIRRLAQLGYQGDLILVSGEDERIRQSAERLARCHGLHVLGALFKPVSATQLRELLAATDASVPAPALAQRKAYAAGDLAEAIAQGQLLNHYQPKVAVATGAVIGVESLVRWQHPTDGLVGPDRFIPLAEESGLIGELTRSVLRRALRDAAAWMEQQVALHVAVNVSMANLRTLEFPDAVEAEAAAAGVPLASLVLEVTESQLMDDPRAALDILTRLRLKRVTLSIDDFGTGHSSLAKLRDVPFNELKIDRGFVHGASHDAPARAILASSLEIARKLGMRSVAEGVETAADWDLLREVGCDLAQGWLIARPMPAADIPGWVRERRKGRALPA